MFTNPRVVCGVCDPDRGEQEVSPCSLDKDTVCVSEAMCNGKICSGGQYCSTANGQCVGNTSDLCFFYTFMIVKKQKYTIGFTIF